MKADLKIKDAVYIKDLTLKIIFSDSTEKVIDFKKFI